MHGALLAKLLVVALSMTGASAGGCSKLEVGTLLQLVLSGPAEGGPVAPNAAMRAFFTTLVGSQQCALCLESCLGGGLPLFPWIICANECLDDARANTCATGTSLPPIEGAALSNASSLLDTLMFPVRSDCRHCIFSTIEAVCGEGCVRDHLHIFTDYTVVPRRCWEALADQLERARGAELEITLQEKRALLLVAPNTTASDLYVATDDVFGGKPVYQGLDYQSWLYACQDGGKWAFSTSSDRSDWQLCRGSLQLQLPSGSFTALQGGSATYKPAVHVWTGLASCDRDSFSNDSLDPGTSNPSAGIFSFRRDASSRGISCYLVRLLGSHRQRDTGPSCPDTMIQIPPLPQPIELQADLVVRENCGVAIQGANPSARAWLSVGTRRVQVKPGGKLSLAGFVIANSITSSAIFSEGRLEVKQCTFRDCTVVENEDMRHPELLQRGLLEIKDDDPRYQGLPLGANGGAIFVAGTRVRTSLCSLEATEFINCSAIGGAASGGAVYAAGGSVRITGNTSFSRNYVQAEGNKEGGAAGGAIAGILLEGSCQIDSTLFEHNSARGDFESTDTSQGGAIYVNGAFADFARASFVSNLAIGGNARTEGGALAAKKSQVSVSSCDFETNEARSKDSEYRANPNVGGGAVALSDKSNLKIAASRFSSNRASGAGQFSSGNSTV